MSVTKVAEERREYLRVPAKGTMVFRAGGRLVHCRLVSISEVGIEATCELGFVEHDLLGADIDFQLRLDGTETGWLDGRGCVTHTRSETHRLIVAIPQPIPELQAVISKFLIELRGSNEVMVVDRDPSRRARTAEAFRAEHYEVFEASTPLEALDHLGRGEPDPKLIEVAPTTPEGVADELRDYLEVAHPESQVVRVSGERSGAVQTRKARARERSALRTRVRAVLARFRK